MRWRFRHDSIHSLMTYTVIQNVPFVPREIEAPDSYVNLPSESVHQVSKTRFGRGEVPVMHSDCRSLRYG